MLFDNLVEFLIRINIVESLVERLRYFEVFFKRKGVVDWFLVVIVDCIF